MSMRSCATTLSRPAGGSISPAASPATDCRTRPRITANLSADYEWSLGGDVEAFVGGNVRLVGDQTAGFNAVYRTAFGRRIELDGYHTVDLRAGVNFGRITLQAFARNLFDEAGLVSATGFPFTVQPELGGTNVQLMNASAIRPRTIGLIFGAGF